MRRLVVVTSLLMSAWWTSSLHAQQRYQYLGPNKCKDCHDHEQEKLWWEKKDGPPPNGHINALNQLDNENTRKYAKAFGYSADDVYEPGNACARCHATVFRGEANAGVSCESCHGPGSGYVDVHQQKGAYKQAVALGMFDTVGQLGSWARLCMSCHVVDDAKLVAAGHPSGDDFDLGQKFAPVVHWKAVYEQSAVRSAARPVRDAILAKRGGPTPVQVASRSAVPDAVSAEPAARPADSARSSAPTVPAAPQPNASSSTPERGAGVAESVAPRPAAARQAPGPPLPGRRAPPSPRPAAPAPLTAEPGGAPLPPLKIPTLSPLPRSPAAAVAAIQGRAITLLKYLLDSGAVVPKRIVPPENLRTYRGVDAELLVLQQEAIELALEALSSPQRPTNVEEQ